MDKDSVSSYSMIRQHIIMQYFLHLNNSTFSEGERAKIFLDRPMEALVVYTDR